MSRIADDFLELPSLKLYVDKRIGGRIVRAVANSTQVMQHMRFKIVC